MKKRRFRGVFRGPSGGFRVQKTQLSQGTISHRKNCVADLVCAHLVIISVGNVRRFCVGFLAVSGIVDTGTPVGRCKLCICDVVGRSRTQPDAAGRSRTHRTHRTQRDAVDAAGRSGTHLAHLTPRMKLLECSEPETHAFGTCAAVLGFLVYVRASCAIRYQPVDLSLVLCAKAAA